MFPSCSHKPFGGHDEARSNVHGLLFHSNDCRKDMGNIEAKGVKITLGPEDQMWGVQAVFEDLYGNSHVMLEPSPMALGQAPAGD